MSDIKTNDLVHLQQRLEKQRREMLNDFASQRDRIERENASITITGDKFITENVSVEHALQTTTVGLVSLEDFQRIRSDIEEKKAQDVALMTSKRP